MTFVFGGTVNPLLLEMIDEATGFTIKGRSCSASEFWDWIESSYITRPFAAVQSKVLEGQWLRRLSKGALKTYLVLCRYADNTNGTCFPSVDRLAAELEVDPRTIRRATAELEKLKLIEKGRYYDFANHKQHNIYKLLVAKEKPDSMEDSEDEPSPSA